MTLLSISALLQKLVQFGDDNYDKERAVEKLFRCVSEKYKQMARSIESLLDLSTMSIEEAIGHLKVVDTDEPQPLSGPITLAGSYFSLGSSGMPTKLTRRRGSLLPRQAAASVANRARRTKTPRPGRENVPLVMPVEAPRVASLASTGRHEMTPAAPASSLAIGPGLSIATTWPGPRRTGGGGGAGSAHGTCEHRVTSSGTGRSGSPPP
jgi:hypothetical protein